MSRFAFEDPEFLRLRLKTLRQRFGFTQADVAQVLGVTRSTYTYYENGTTRPDPAALGKLAHLYDLPVEVFYQEKLEDETKLWAADPGHRKRTSRVGAGVDPQRVGELWPIERQLILLLRTNGKVNADTVVKRLKAYLNEQQKDEDA